MPGEQIAPGKLVSAMLTFIRPIAGVYCFFGVLVRCCWWKLERKKLTGSHVASNMLRTSKSSIANGTFVVTSHLGGKGRKRRWSSASSSCKSDSLLLLCPSTTLWWSYHLFGFVDMTSLHYIIRSPDTCHSRSDQSTRQIEKNSDVTTSVLPLLFVTHLGETGMKTSARALYHKLRQPFGVFREKKQN